MKIIYRIDTDDLEKITDITDKIYRGNEIAIPTGSLIKVYVISDSGEVKEI